MMVFRIALAVCAAALLAACSPDYDWRRVQPAEGGFAAMLPARPASMTRQVALEGLAIEMSLHGARIDETSYTVGVLRLPDNTPATRDQVLAALRQSMVANIGGTESASSSVQVRVEDGSGQRRGTAPALQVQARGTMRKQPAVLSARFVAQEERIWQVMVLAPESAARRAGYEDSLTQFLDGFVLIAR